MLLHQNLMLTGHGLRDFVPYHDTILSQSPLAYFLINGTGVPTDSSGNGNDMLVLTGSNAGFAATSSMVGDSESAMDMDGGGSWATNITSSDTWITTIRSLSCVVNLQSSVASEPEYIASLGDVNDGWRFGVADTGSGDQWTYTVYGTGLVLSATNTFGSVSTGTPYHVGLSWSGFTAGSTWKVYINGVEVDSALLFSGLTYATFGQFIIGSIQSQSLSSNWSGVMEKVAVWDRTLSATEFLTQAQRAGLA